MLPVAALAQVSYTGTAATQNFGSQAIGSASAVRTFNFSVTAGTTVGSIAVVTQGAPNLDFTSAAGGTCAAQTYSSATTCTVNVTLTPRFAGWRRGAVVFYSAANNTGNQLGSVPINGVGTGPQIAYGPGTVVNILSELGDASLLPNCTTVDGAGDLFISDVATFDGADPTNSGVVEVPAGGRAWTEIYPSANGISLNYPAGLAVDGAGNLFIADQGGARVLEVPAGGGAAIAIQPVVNGTGLYEPAGAAVDAVGDLFIGDYGNNRVVEVPAGNGAPVLIDPTVTGKTLNLPAGVALDQAGDLFIADYGNNRVVEVPAGGGAATAIDPTVSGLWLSSPTDVALDGAGDLFIADYGNTRVVEVPAGGGAATVALMAGLINCVTLDDAGDLFISANPGFGTPGRVLVEALRSQPPALSFPTPTDAGSIDTTDGSRTEQIQNIGNEALTLTALSYPADFSEASGDGNACTGSTSLGVGRMCDLPIEFSPENIGSLSENVTLTDNALNVAGAQQSIAVSGVGVSPTVASHFSITTMATVYAGTPFSIAVTALNLSNSTATGYNGTVSFTSSDPDFVNPGPLTLSNGVGHATATLNTFGTQTIRATDIVTPSLTGTGSFAVASAPPPAPLVTYTGTAANQNFGSQAVGSTSAARTLSFSVAAGTTVGSIGVVTTGLANLDFANAAGSTCTAMTYASTSSCTVNATFAPMDPGLRQGAVVFFSGPNNTGTVVGSVLVYGVGTGPLLAFGFGAPLVLAQGEISPEENENYGIADPIGLTTDEGGDVFVNFGFFPIPSTSAAKARSLNLADYSRDAAEVSAGGESLIDAPGSGGMAVDGAGDLFTTGVGGSYGGGVVEAPVGGGAYLAIDPVVNGITLSGASGVAVDATGDLFIADTGNNRVVEVPAGGGAAVAIDPTVGGKGLNNPTDVKLDAAGDLFIADQGNNRVVEVPPAGGGAASAVNGAGVGIPTFLALDVLGDLFILGANDGAYVEVPAGGGAAFSLNLPSFDYCSVPGQVISTGGIATDSAGDLFVSTFFEYSFYDPSYPDPNVVEYWSFVCEFPRSQPPALNFPTATNEGAVDTTDGTQTVQIQNIGNAALALSGLSYPADFSEASGDTNACTASTSLSAGQKCDVPIEFTPKHAGALSENVTLTDNTLDVAGTKQSIAVSGTGLAATALISPTPGTVLAGTSVTFMWTAGTGATEFDLWLGFNGAGSSDLYSSGVIAATSATVTGLPTKGATIYARLYYSVAGLWHSLDYTYTEASTAAATMISPSQGTTLGVSGIMFNWTAGTLVTNYALWLGTSGPGSSSLYASPLSAARSVTVPKLPAKGAKVYARLYSEGSGGIQYVDYTYTEQ
ncbi:MAG: choice-of-anchor D domain-containing protein [Terracidiphilus sp.]